VEQYAAELHEYCYYFCYNSPGYRFCYNPSDYCDLPATISAADGAEVAMKHVVRTLLAKRLPLNPYQWYRNYVYCDCERFFSRQRELMRDINEHKVSSFAEEIYHMNREKLCDKYGLFHPDSVNSGFFHESSRLISGFVREYDLREQLVTLLYSLARMDDHVLSVARKKSELLQKVHTRITYLKNECGFLIGVLNFHIDMSVIVSVATMTDPWQSNKRFSGVCTYATRYVYNNIARNATRNSTLDDYRHLDEAELCAMIDAHCDMVESEIRKLFALDHNQSNGCTMPMCTESAIHADS